MNETRRKPTTGRQSPSLFDKWPGIFYMPSRIDEAGHTKAFGCVFQVHTNTYMLYVFDMATDQERILEQTGSDIENWL